MTTRILHEDLSSFMTTFATRAQMVAVGSNRKRQK
jgi:hypothetical protein